MRTYMLAIVTCLLTQASLAEQRDGVVSVSKSEARCIADNVGVFLDEPDDPVTIYLDICVPAEKLSGLVAGNIRSDLPSINRAKTGANPTKSIVVSKAALRCLKVAAGTPGFPKTEPVVLVANCQ